jgi:ribosomal protein S14
MRQKNKRILKEVIKRKHYIKLEFKKKIYKSIVHNNNYFNLHKTINSFKINNNKKKAVSFQRNVCFKTGRFRNVYRYNNLSRHAFKKLNLEGRIQNIKNLSW